MVRQGWVRVVFNLEGVGRWEGPKGVDMILNMSLKLRKAGLLIRVRHRPFSSQFPQLSYYSKSLS